MISLNDKRIIITGASSGIGRATAILASELGASLVLFGRNQIRLNETLSSLKGDGHEAYIVDITDHQMVNEIIKKSVDSFGVVSGLVHSAGIEKTIPIKVSKNSVFREVFEINVFAGFEIARILSQKNYFDPNGTSLIFISSIMGKVAEQGKLVYCSSKSALLAGSRALAVELAPKKIRSNCILPGIVETEMVEELFKSIPVEAKEMIIQKHPLSLGKPVDVASLICFMLSDHARWITGSEYIIDGGFSSK